MLRKQYGTSSYEVRTESHEVVKVRTVHTHKALCRLILDEVADHARTITIHVSDRPRTLPPHMQKGATGNRSRAY